MPSLDPASPGSHDLAASTGSAEGKEIEPPRALEVDTVFAAEVVAALVHEVRQPLSGLMLNAEAGLRSLARPHADSDDSRAALQRVLRDARRLADVLERTKSVYLESPRGFHPFMLGAAIGEATDFAWRKLNALRIDTVTRIAGDSPTVWGNRLQIQQVIYNLMVNAADAIEASPEGPRVIEIVAEPVAPQGMRISIADTGCGFDLDAQPQMFQRFFTTKSHGAGLGLAICAAILKAHGSALTAARRAPRGAVFSFTLPCAPT